MLRMIDSPRIEYACDHKTYKEVVFYIFDEEYAIRKRIKSIDEAVPVANKMISMLKDSDGRLLKALEDFEFLMEEKKKKNREGNKKSD